MWQKKVKTPITKIRHPLTKNGGHANQLMSSLFLCDCTTWQNFFILRHMIDAKVLFLLMSFLFGVLYFKWGLKRIGCTAKILFLWSHTFYKTDFLFFLSMMMSVKDLYSLKFFLIVDLFIIVLMHILCAVNSCQSHPMVSNDSLSLIS